MNTADQISLASVIVAMISLIGNLVLTLRLHRLTLATTDQNDLHKVLEALLSELERTQLFTKDPWEEVWEDGFRTLREVGRLAADAKIAIARRLHVPAVVHRAVGELSSRVNNIRRFEDGYNGHRYGKQLSPREVQKTWPQWPASVDELRELQRQVASAKATIVSYLAR